MSAIALVDIGLVGDLPQGVHGQDGNAGVDDVHAILGHDVGNGAAAARVDATELTGLKSTPASSMMSRTRGHVLGIGVVGAAPCRGCPCTC